MRGTFTVRDEIAALQLPPLELAPTVELFGEQWPAKSEFHVTLLGREAFRKAGSERVDRAARGLDFDVHLGDEFYRLDEDDVRTLIVMCGVENADRFYERVGIAEPPLHVSLYMIGTDIGIGLSSHEDLVRLGTLIEGSARDTLLQALHE